MTSSCPPAVTSQPGLVNTDMVIAEANLSLPKFKNYGGSGRCPSCCFCIRCCFCSSSTPRRRRLYLTQSSIVFCAGDFKGHPAYKDFGIDLSNIECIRTIDKELYRYINFRSEVRTYGNLIIQLKEDSSEKIFMKGNTSCCSCSRFDVDSFYHVCSNGDDFVQAVKQQIAALNIANE